MSQIFKILFLLSLSQSVFSYTVSAAPAQSKGRKLSKTPTFAAIFASSTPKNRSFLREDLPAWNELNMPLLIKAVDRTLLSSGSSEFTQLIRPIQDVEALKQRQKIMKLLVKNKSFISYDALLREFKDKDYESLFHQLYNDAHEASVLENATPEDLNFLKKSWKANSVTFRLFMTATSIFGLFNGLFFDLHMFRNNRHQVFDGNTPLLPRLWLGTNTLIQFLGMAYGGQLTYYSVQELFQKISQTDEFVLKLAEAIELFERVQKNATSPDHPFFNAPWQKSALRFLALTKEKPELKRTLSKIQSRFNKKDDYVLSTFAMLESVSIFDSIKSQREDFVYLLKTLAQLDAYMSAARLYREFDQDQISFAQYHQSESPYFEFKNLSNPIVNSSIPNDFSLGQDHRFVVLSGPHGCGKTTSMKTIFFAFVLGQSLTFVPAQAANFKVVTDVKSYLNIGDNIAEGLSSFMTEHKRMHQLFESAQNLKANENVLYLIDEPYAKTIQNIGEPRVTEFLRQTSALPQLAIILATHFEEPTILEAESHGRVKNWQPEIIEHADGTFQPTYKIIDGAADWWFKNIRKRNAFIEWLVHRD